MAEHLKVQSKEQKKKKEKGKRQKFITLFFLLNSLQFFSLQSRELVDTASFHFLPTARHA
jgi:hypothetical protein